MTDEAISEEQRERFTRLAWPYADTVLRLAKHFAGSTADAEDLAQDTLVKAMRAIDKFQDGSNMKAWLTIILKRTFIDRLRVSQRRGPVQSLDTVNEVVASEQQETAGAFDDQWEEPEDLMARFEDQAVIDALQTLPENIRWTLVLLDVEQMDQSAVAGILEVPIGTIKSRAHYGRKMLRDLLYRMALKRGWVTTAESPSL